MRSFVYASAALMALAGCASTSQTREMQAPRLAPTSSVLFPIQNEYRDAVVLEWIGGVDQYSYVLQKIDQEMLRPLIARALNASGLAAATPVRARYGLRVTVTDVDGAHVASTTAHMVATYSIVERRTGREVFTAR